MTHAQQLENLYQEALDNFPYNNLQSTGITQGNFQASSGFVEFAEEYTFKAGTLFNEKLLAGGWIELRQDSPDEDPIITAFLGVARNGDWEKGRILPDQVAVQGHYDITAKTWDLWIDQY